MKVHGYHKCKPGVYFRVHLSTIDYNYSWMKVHGYHKCKTNVYIIPYSSVHPLMSVPGCGNMGLLMSAYGVNQTRPFGYMNSPSYFISTSLS